ncbi:MAG: putative DNA binding domain-containing protein [Candidatus Omnitrophica bacterium]|nr:putative DNA binding domain-containing protein [Candidatus Omnitrophota bacterium]
MKTKSASKLIGSSESMTIEWKPSFAQMGAIVESVAAFANTEGGRLFIGVSKTGSVLGISIGKDTIENLTNRIAQSTEPKIHPRITISKVDGKEIIVIDVKESRDKLVLANGRPYVRVGKSTRQMSKDEYEGRILEKHKEELNFDSQICKGAKIADISKEKLIAFVKKAKQERGLGINPKASVTDILKKLKLTKHKKITNAAILLFGHDPQDFFLQVELKAIRFRGYDVTGEMTDFKTIGADAITLLEKAEQFIFDHISMKAWIESGKLQRQEKWLYPPDAIREGLANAIIHRDYCMQGTSIYVCVYDDRVEVESPGGFAPGVTMENFGTSSIRRNHIIADMFHRMRKVERMGSGIKKMRRLMEDAG